jgi:DNA uptake protein ComE-like DNA-binding protein
VISARATTPSRAGMTYAVTLWLIVAMTALAISLASGARTRRYHAATLEARVGAQYVEQAALRYVLRGLADTSGVLPTESELPCAAMQVGEGAFWVLRGDEDGDGVCDYGLQDEGGKIDLNLATIDTLAKLPRMTRQIAATIVDWRDADDQVTEGGAESDFYLRESEPYEAKNAPFETVLELRLIAEMDDEILYGEDTNRNGMLDPAENDGSDTTPDDDHDGTLDPGLAGLTTAFVSWPEDNNERTLQVNNASRQEIREALGEIIEDDARADQLADAIMEHRPFPSIFHLHYACGLTTEEFPECEQRFAVAPPQGDPGFRLNVNAAAVGALQCLPELTEADAQLLAEARVDAEPGQSLAWMLDVLPQEKLLAAAAGGITGRSYQYTADILSVVANGRAFRRVRYVIDVSTDSPKVVHRLDLSHWGWPLDMSLLNRLRAGEPIEEVLADAQAT